MSRQIFFKVTVALLMMLSLKLTYGQIGPQMKDFLCGCKYCETVDTGEPLDIGGHMIRCHSWRKGMQRTMELMRKTEQPKIEVEIRTEQPAIEQNFLGETQGRGAGQGQLAGHSPKAQAPNIP